MRIFIVTQADTSNHYGIGRYIETIIKEVKQRDETHKLIVLTLGVLNLNGVRVNQKTNITFIEIPRSFVNSQNLHISPIYATAVFCILNDYFELNKKDIFHFNSNTQYYLIQTIKERLSPKIIYTVHVSLWKVLFNNNFEEFRKSFYNHSENIDKIKSINAEKRNCELATSVICLSGEMKKDIVNIYGIDTGKVKVITNGLPKDDITPTSVLELETIRQTFDIKADDFLMLYVGRIINQKGVEALFTSVELLVNQGVKNFKLILVGDGDLKEHLSQKYEKIKDFFKFAGYMSPEKIQSFYELANVIVFPSLNEQSSYVMLEAMKFKVPLIVSEIEAFRKLIDSKTCFKIRLANEKSVDVHDLTKTLKHCMQEDSLCNQIAGEAFVLFERLYSSERMFVRTYN